MVTNFGLPTLAAAAIGVAWILRRVQVRLRLSRAKHPSLRGHARMSRRLAGLVPFYEYDEAEALACDGAAEDMVARRREGFARLSQRLAEKNARTRAQSAALEPQVSDMQFTNANRVPFQFRSLVRTHLPVGAVSDATSGVRIRDIDGNWSYDVSGSYGVNLLGYDFYKGAIERGAARVRELGPVLGPYHPLIRENVEAIRSISGLDEVSFHMSGTEAVMQAVRLARYHRKRDQLVLFCGAYHGWWDGVQAGVGHRRSLDDIYMLKDMSDDTLRVLRTRKDIACVLVNPLQGLHPNAGASSDAMLIDSSRDAGFDRDAYAAWLRELRQVCTEKGIVLIFDEVFVGFRLGLGGAQEYFDVQADMVTYGKTIGGGLPIGVLAGKAELMKRYRDDRPTDLCFARGTFNSHPYVMASMNEFLRHVNNPEWAAWARDQDHVWNERAAALNARLESADLPVRVRNLASVWLLTYTRPGRFNWLLQFYLRAEGLALSWVGTGRFIFSHDYTDEDFADVADRIVRAADAMRSDGWWSEAERLSNKDIRRQVLREILAQLAGRRRASGAAWAKRQDSARLPRARAARESSGR
jgi:glutamate-1-semialdehyde 2,1-aminomutase